MNNASIVSCGALRWRYALQYGAGAVKDKGVVKFRKVEIKPL